MLDNETLSPGKALLYLQMLLKKCPLYWYTEVGVPDCRDREVYI